MTEKLNWQEVPSVSPGGKKSFFVTITPQGKRTVAWGRLEQKWAVQGDQEAPRGDSPTFGLFTSAKEGKEFAETASEMGLNSDQLKQAAKEGVTTALGLRRIEKNTRGLGEWVSPADKLEWSEPKDKLEKIAAEFRKHYGEKVKVWGGGGAPPSLATLVRVELHPTILKDRDGYTLKAFVKDADSKILPVDKNGIFDPWLGSWQIAVKGKGNEADKEPAELSTAPSDLITIDLDDPTVDVWRPAKKPRKPGKLVLLVKKKEQLGTTLGGMK